MHTTLTVFSALFAIAGIGIYAFWDKIGLPCPCPGSACIALGALCFLCRRFF